MVKKTVLTCNKVKANYVGNLPVGDGASKDREIKQQNNVLIFELNFFKHHRVMDQHT